MSTPHSHDKNQDKDLDLDPDQDKDKDLDQGQDSDQDLDQNQDKDQDFILEFILNIVFITIIYHK